MTSFTTPVSPEMIMAITGLLGILIGYLQFRRGQRTQREQDETATVLERERDEWARLSEENARLVSENASLRSARDEAISQRDALHDARIADTQLDYAHAAWDYQVTRRLLELGLEVELPPPLRK